MEHVKKKVIQLVLLNVLIVKLINLDAKSVKRDNSLKMIKLADLVELDVKHVLMEIIVPLVIQ